MAEGKKSPNWNKNDSSPILKIMALPIAIVIIALGIMTILGGHITPGGGFQGGAMIAGAIIFCVIVYGVDGEIMTSGELRSGVAKTVVVCYDEDKRLEYDVVY